MNNQMISVKNRSASVVVYRIPEANIRRSFAPGETKRVSAKELEQLTFRPGGMALLLNYLQIQDENTLKNIGAKVEPEYHMSEKDIAKLITSGSLDEFLDTLDFAPEGVINLIKQLSVKIPLVDISKRKALKEKTGFDVEAALKHVEEEKEDDGNNTILKTNNQRRVVKEEVPEGRRTTAPKYNVVKTITEEGAENKTE